MLEWRRRDVSSALPAIGVAYLTQIPLWLVWLGGLVAAVMTRRRHPKVSLLVVLALLTLVVGTALFIGMNVWLPGYLAARSYGPVDVRLYDIVAGAAHAVSNAVACGLLLAAIFGRRQDQE
jgi:hypothetical protein